MLRRDFLRLIAAAGSGGAATALGVTLPRPAAASAPGSAVALPAYAAGSGASIARAAPPIGIQLYSLRSLLADDTDRTLAALAAMGYEEVELAGLYGHDAGDFRRMLDRVGLRAPAGHVSLEPPPASGPWTSWERTLEEAATLGHRWVVVPWIDQRERTLDGYRRIAERFNAAGAAARAAGLRFGYHNHDFEFRAIDGVLPYDLLLAETEAELVGMELDIFWAVHAGADPLAYFRRHPGRFPLIHVKDRNADGEMVDVGAGRIDFRAILEAGDIGGVEHAIIEHDNPKAPLDFARASLAHVRGLLTPDAAEG